MSSATLGVSSIPVGTHIDGVCYCTDNIQTLYGYYSDCIHTISKGIKTQLTWIVIVTVMICCVFLFLFN